MILSHKELIKLVDQGVLNADKRNVNGSSIDITLGKNILIEERSLYDYIPIDLVQEVEPVLKERTIPDTGYDIRPNQFLLGHSVEWFNLPANISAEYKLKSSLARAGLEHLTAGWIDPTWSGNLTLELKNVTQYHNFKLREGMKIGQIVFFKHEEVDEGHSYKRWGRYNGSEGVVKTMGV